MQTRSTIPMAGIEFSSIDDQRLSNEMKEAIL
jgi:hypothetical protein